LGVVETETKRDLAKVVETETFLRVSLIPEVERHVPAGRIIFETSIKNVYHCEKEN
jgi:hypothetical protein